MKSDGAVIIDTQLRPDGMEKGFKEIKRGAQSVVNDVQGATEKINAAFSKVDVSKPVSNAALKVESLKQQLSSVTSEFNLAVADNDDKAAERLAAKRISLYDRLEAARKKLEIEVAAAANREAAAEEKAAKRAAAAAEKEAARKERAAKKLFDGATKGATRFNNRLLSIAASAIVFNAISAGLREVTQYFGNALKASDDYTQAVSRLNGALLVAFQPIYEYVLPELTAFVHMLADAVQALAVFLATISGKSYSEMVRNAKALYEQSKALDKVGSSAKNAAKGMAAFDEITKVNKSGTATSTIAPSFDLPEENAKVSEELKGILGFALAIGAGIAAWKISSAFAGALSTTSLAIGLLAAGVALVIVSLEEWIRTGELSNEMCIALNLGLLAIGAAIALLTGSWIPLLVAAVVAAVITIGTKGDEIQTKLQQLDDFLQNVFATDWRETFGPVLGSALNGGSILLKSFWNSVETTLNGGIDFIRGIFTGDMSRAIDGLIQIIGGQWSMFGTILLAPFSALGTFIHNLSQEFLPDTWKTKINAIIEVVNKFVRWLNEKLTITIEPIEVLGNVIYKGSTIRLANIPEIPMLAQGAVIPPNAPFAAVLGDQRNGRNLEAPEGLIRTIFQEEIAEFLGGMMGGFEALLEENRRLRAVVEGIEVGDTTIGQAANRYNRELNTSRGGV